MFHPNLQAETPVAEHSWDLLTEKNVKKKDAGQDRKGSSHRSTGDFQDQQNAQKSPEDFPGRHRIHVDQTLDDLVIEKGHVAEDGRRDQRQEKIKRKGPFLKSRIEEENKRDTEGKMNTPLNKNIKTAEYPGIELKEGPPGREDDYKNSSEIITV